MTMWFDRKRGDVVGGIRVSQGSERTLCPTG
jgi:hypothetical protein